MQIFLQASDQYGTCFYPDLGFVLECNCLQYQLFQQLIFRKYYLYLSFNFLGFDKIRHSVAPYILI